LTFDGGKVSGETFLVTSNPPGLRGVILPLHTSYSPTSFTFQTRTSAPDGTYEYEYVWTGGVVTPTSFSGTHRFSRYSPTPFSDQQPPQPTAPTPYFSPTPYTASRIPSYAHCVPPVTPKPTPKPSPKPSPNPTVKPSVQPTGQPTAEPTLPPTIDTLAPTPLPAAGATGPTVAPNSPSPPSVAPSAQTTPQVFTGAPYTGTGAAQMGGTNEGGGGGNGSGGLGNSLPLIIGIGAGIVLCLVLAVICIARRRRTRRGAAFAAQQGGGSYRMKSRRTSAATGMAGMRGTAQRPGTAGVSNYAPVSSVRMSQATVGTSPLTYGTTDSYQKVGDTGITSADGQYGNLTLSMGPTVAAGQYDNVSLATESSPGVYAPAGSVQPGAGAAPTPSTGVYSSGAAVRTRRGEDGGTTYTAAPYRGASDRAPAPLPPYTAQAYPAQV
jgi:hypothetical protein